MNQPVDIQHESTALLIH